MSAALALTPTGTVYHVRLRRGPEQSSGGIWLPETYQDVFTEAEVLAAGPGMTVVGPDGDTHRSVMWARVGDHVLFQKSAFVPFSNGGQEGTVRDEDLVGVVRGDAFTEVVEPLNDWVRVMPSAPEPVSSLIEQPEAYRRAPRRGVVEDLGPGRLRLVGRLAGLRVPVFRELGLRSSYGLLGRVVRWGENAEVLDVGSEVLECVLVRAGDLLALEEVEDGGTT